MSTAMNEGSNRALRLLAIETSGQVGSVALAEDYGVVRERSFTEGLRHGRDLMPSIRDLFDEAGWAQQEFDLVAVSIGPGSFTGLRVGVTCAKTLAFALDKPIVAVPSLDVLAENAPPDVEVVCPVLDARRDFVYAAVYRKGGSRRVPEADLMVNRPEKVCEIIPEKALVFGDGAERYRQVFERRNVIFGGAELAIPRAAVVAKLGRMLFERGERADAMTLVPLYMRRPEAEEKWDAAQSRRP